MPNTIDNQLRVYGAPGHLRAYVQRRFGPYQGDDKCFSDYAHEKADTEADIMDGRLKYAYPTRGLQFEAFARMVKSEPNLMFDWRRSDWRGCYIGHTVASGGAMRYNHGQTYESPQGSDEMDISPDFWPIWYGESWRVMSRPGDLTADAISGAADTDSAELPSGGAPPESPV